jgi:hypothetical protein
MMGFRRSVRMGSGVHAEGKFTALNIERQSTFAKC